MPDIASIGYGPVGPIDRSNHRVDRSEAAAASKRSDATPGEGDRVELSAHARFLDKLRQLPDVRHSRVEDVRQAIAEGSYETDEKLGAVIESLIEELGLDEQEE